jgi:hypothetical protein
MTPLLFKVQHGMRLPNGGGFGATGVAGVAATCANPLKLQSLRPLRQKNDKGGNAFRHGYRQAVNIAISSGSI